MFSALTNKHVIVAMIVAPILAILSYFAVDYSVSEKPQQAIEGLSYPLIAKSNCRYSSGKCTFENGDISISLTPEWIDKNTLRLRLSSTLPLEGVKMGLTAADLPPSPQTMRDNNQERTEWEIHFANKSFLNSRDKPIDNSQLQLALLLNGSVYYGETGTLFTHYKTNFSQEGINN